VTSVFLIKLFLGIKLVNEGTTSALMVYSVTSMLFILTSFRNSENRMSQFQWKLTMVKQWSCLQLALFKHRLPLMFVSSGLLPAEQLMIRGS